MIKDKLIIIFKVTMLIVGIIVFILCVTNMMICIKNIFTANSVFKLLEAMLALFFLLLAGAVELATVIFINIEKFLK